jgi:hypothetical protein
MEDDKIVTLQQPGKFTDPLTEVLRNGARQLLTQAVEAELAECLEMSIPAEQCTVISVTKCTNQFSSERPWPLTRFYRYAASA